ncbi:MAG: hypothetical protein WDM80_06000 [Limisphaerales bacterium]
MRRTFFTIFTVFLTASASALPLSLVSVHDDFQVPPAGGNGDSRAPILTPDGRYVLFTSTANNLVAINGSNSLPVVGAQKFNVFQRDRMSGTTLLVSVNLAASGGGSGDSIPTATSDDGRYALFESDATNLVSNDTNGLTDVFLRDVWSNTTVLVSVTTNGFSGNGVSRGSTLTPDGRYVAFTSAATNLVANDTNGIADVFVRDLQTGVTRLASVNAKAASSYSVLGSESPEISADGRYVAFYTVATNLVPGVTNSGEIFIRDLVASTTTWASAGAHTRLGSKAVSFNLTLSADGNFVAYEACTNSGSGYVGAVFRFNRTSGLTDLIYTNAYTPTASFEDFHDLNMTPDGRFIAFVANSNSITATSIYLWDAQSGINTLVSRNLNGGVSLNSICDWPAVDTSGRFVTFLSSASGLVTNSVTSDYHLYLADLQAGMTRLVDADTNGVGVGVGVATVPQLSADGTLVAFEASNSSLVSNDRNHDIDIFVRDSVAATNELISAHDSNFPSASPNGNTGIAALSSSTDGRWLTFASEADNLVFNDTNGFRDIFVRDFQFGTNLLVSVGTNGVSADGISSEPAISTSGGFVVFSSSADNLVKGDTNKVQDVFVRILPAGPTVLVSTNASGPGQGNKLSGSASISGDGRYVLFRSQASNLAAGSFSGTENLFLRDMQTRTTYALTTTGLNSASMTPDGRLVAFTGTTGPAYVWDSQAARLIQTNAFLSGATNISISPDGSKLAGFVTSFLALSDRIAGTNGSIASRYRLGSRAGVRFSFDGRFLTYAAGVSAFSSNQVYLYDFQTRKQALVSTAANSILAANGISDSPDISADGRYVAYRSFATNLITGGTSNNVPDLFLYDSFSGTSSLLTADRLNGGPTDNRSRTPVFSPDGRTLFFQSSASDLVPLDFNHNGDVLALMFLYVSIVPDNGSGAGPMLTWPNRPGETYQVQFKDSLSDPAWQDVGGSVTVIGNRASVQNLVPSTGQRFYRVVAF